MGWELALRRSTGYCAVLQRLWNIFLLFKPYTVSQMKSFPWKKFGNWKSAGTPCFVHSFILIFIWGICEHDFQRSAGAHSLSLGSMNLSSSSGALSPLRLSLISLFAYCSLVFLFVLLFPLIHSSNAAFPGASWDCTLQTFQIWAHVEQISSSCPSVQVSTEEGSVVFSLHCIGVDSQLDLCECCLQSSH